MKQRVVFDVDRKASESVPKDQRLMLSSVAIQDLVFPADEIGETERLDAERGRERLGMKLVVVDEIKELIDTTTKHVGSVGFQEMLRRFEETPCAGSAANVLTVGMAFRLTNTLGGVEFYQGLRKVRDWLMDQDRMPATTLFQAIKPGE